MPRVGVAGIFHETNTYAAPTPLAAFQVLRGQEIVTFSRGARTYLGGLLDEGAAQGFELIPLLYAEATPSGLIQSAAYRTLRDELVEHVAVSGLDGLLLSLHGAGVAEGVDSIEEDICTALRARVGKALPIVATLDLHGNVRQQLGDLCQGLFPVRFNPHVDQHERGVEASRCLSDALFDGARFETSIEQVPLIFPPVPTNAPVLAELDRICTELEKSPGVVSARLMHGFPYADTPNIGASAVVVTRRGEADSRAIARRLATELWQRRRLIKVDSADAADAVQEALRDGRSMIVINEFSDNTGAGCPGDGTHLLAALIAAGAHACFSHVNDPDTVAQAASAGVGARIRVELGGRNHPLSGEPVRAQAEVLGLGNGIYRVKSPMGTGETIDLGLLATLRIGSVDVIVSNGRRQTLDDGPFIKAGIDISDYPIVAVKSSQHFRAWYEERAVRIITADSPGLSPVDVARLQRRRLQRQLWPLDAAANYRDETTQEPA